MALSCSSGANVSVTGGRSHTVEQAAVRGKTVRACWPARIVRFPVGKWVSSGELMPVRERVRRQFNFGLRDGILAGMPVRERVRGQACVRIRGQALIGARVGVGFRAWVVGGWGRGGWGAGAGGGSWGRGGGTGGGGLFRGFVGGVGGGWW